MRKTLALLAVLAATLMASAQPAGFESFSVGPFKAGHVQGIAVDQQNGYVYFSFTTMLVKTDMQGRVLGSVTGFLGHLGCITFNPADGRVYGSLEYKDDAIGQGIQRLEGTNVQFPHAWYVASFDGSKIDRCSMDFATSGVMQATYLKTVVDDYDYRQGAVEHKYGCSGIDGVTFGPRLKGDNGKQYLTVAYGIYTDLGRIDNDYQVLLQYDLSKINKLAQPLTQDNLHQSGPGKPDGKYFVYTGNTDWGVQNLSYEPNGNKWFMLTYRGKKPGLQNRTCYVIDGNVKAQRQALKGVEPTEQGMVLQLLQQGSKDAANGVYGWECPWGAYGFAPAGNDYYYIAIPRTLKGGQGADLHLYKWDGVPPTPFAAVK